VTICDRTLGFEAIGNHTSEAELAGFFRRLEGAGWVDHQTRAVLVDVTVCIGLGRIVAL
jgi:hypothetical protein